MALEAIGSATLGKISEWLVEPISRQLGYLFCFSNNIEDLETELRNLQVRREEVELAMYEDIGKLRTVSPRVKKWVNEARNIESEAERIVQRKNQVKGLLNGWRPNLKLRFLLSKKAKKTSLSITALLTDSLDDTRTSYPLHPSMLEPVPNTEFIEFKSRSSATERVIEALKDDKINLIGISGMAGVGKTTLLKKVSQRARHESLFDEVIHMVVVGRDPDLRRVQKCIAETLGLELDMENETLRSSMLRRRILQNHKKILVVLDDIWAEFELKDLGIPLGEGHRGCKVIYGSRKKDLWSTTQTKTDISLGELSQEESWNLFRDRAGDSAAATDVQHKAREIVKLCGGLPLALVTVGRALHNKDKHYWVDACHRLKNPSGEYLESNSSEVPAVVYSCIKLSYDYLRHKEAAMLFLLCCLFEDVHNILIENLVRYSMGLKLCKDISELETLRPRVHVLVGRLKSCYLLLDCDDDEHVKMHDVVHQVAIAIASSVEHGFMMVHGRESGGWPDGTDYESSCISVASDGLTEFPEGLSCPKLELLRIQCGIIRLSLPCNFFDRMRELKVLDLQRMCIQLLPLSLEQLSKLKTLCIDHCEVDDISVIGRVFGLEILSLRGSSIQELPKEIKELKKLRMLDMRGCKRLRRISPGVISRLLNLQELYMRGSSFGNWGGEDRNGEERSANLGEFVHSSNLKLLEINIRDAGVLPATPLFGKLKDYRIVISNYMFGLDNNIDEEEEDSRKFDRMSVKVGLKSEAAKRNRDEVVAVAESTTREKLGMESTPLGSFIKFESRMRIMEEIMVALKDESVVAVAIVGVGGVGKTMLANEIAKRVQEENLFNEIAIAAVGMEPELTAIQRDIAKILGLKLEEKNLKLRACQLKERLHKNKSLVILDDVWRNLDLEAIGIPKSCKVLITSRHAIFHCNLPNTKKFDLGALSLAESWQFFGEKAGYAVDTSGQQSIATELMEECAGLPLVLAIVGCALAGRNVDSWEDTLRRLQVPNYEQDEWKARVFRGLDISYDYLENEARVLFLFCCLFGEDVDIPIEVLVGYAMGLKFFQGVHEMGKARDRVMELIDQLRTRSLLLSSNKDAHVKMHDLVRDYAILKASEDESYLTRIAHSFECREGSRNASREHYRWISILLEDDEDHPEMLIFPRAELLRIDNKKYSEEHGLLLRFPDSFFEAMAELKVTDLQGMNIPRLPSSIARARNLRTLCLEGSHHSLKDVAVIGELLNLEILSFRETAIEMLPEETGKLCNLMLLNLTGCRTLNRIPPGVISGLVQLQELYMTRSFRDWEAGDGDIREEGIRNVGFNELASLSKLNILEVEIRDAAVLPKLAQFSRLKKYTIVVSNYGDLPAEY
ncbi:hypothetical protein NMG60_11003533 [Bertholletia excelsa]